MPATMHSTACSISLSANTTIGDLPPSSRLMLLLSRAAATITCSPTALLPVNEIFATSLCATNGAPTAGPVPTTMLSTPGGSPTSSAIAPSSSSTSGVISDGLSTTVQPAASAGATFQAVVTSGKFQGTISAATPAGSKRSAAPNALSGSGTG